MLCVLVLGFFSKYKFSESKLVFTVGRGTTEASAFRESDFSHCATHNSLERRNALTYGLDDGILHNLLFVVFGARVQAGTACGSLL